MIMSQCIVPKWNLRQGGGGEGEERNRSPHVQNHLSNVVPMSNHEEAVRELRWENGQISVLHALNLPKQTWELEEGCNTLESIVNQATNFPSSSSNSQVQLKVNTPPSWIPVGDGAAKRGRYNSCDDHINHTQSACGSASATFGRDADATMMTWTSLESPRSLKSARLTNDQDDSLYQDYSENQEGERTTKEESCRSQSSARRSRAAAVHNLSERRRRDRINQKMKTLQKLVPNASKTDKASMLDEVIEYLKQLQAQIHMMSNARNMPMMMPMGMQQLQMSLMARMGMGGMGMGMGMLDVNNLNRNIMPHSFPSLMHAGGGATPSFVPPPFTMPPPLKPSLDSATVSNSVPNFNDAYNTFIAQQSMNMDFLNKMSALYRQQQPSNKTVSLSQPNHGQGE